MGDKLDTSKFDSLAKSELKNYVDNLYLPSGIDSLIPLLIVILSMRTIALTIPQHNQFALPA